MSGGWPDTHNSTQEEKVRAPGAHRRRDLKTRYWQMKYDVFSVKNFGEREGPGNLFHS